MCSCYNYLFSTTLVRGQPLVASSLPWKVCYGDSHYNILLRLIWKNSRLWFVMKEIKFINSVMPAIPLHESIYEAWGTLTSECPPSSRGKCSTSARLERSKAFSPDIFLISHLKYFSLIFLVTIFSSGLRFRSPRNLEVAYLNSKTSTEVFEKWSLRYRTYTQNIWVSSSTSTYRLLSPYLDTITNTRVPTHTKVIKGKADQQQIAFLACYLVQSRLNLWSKSRKYRPNNTFFVI